MKHVRFERPSPPHSRRRDSAPPFRRWGRLGTLAGLAALLWGAQAQAQELETRFYTNVPVGLNLLQFGYARSTGNILVDPALPIEGLDAQLNVTQVKYGRTIDFWGKSGKVEALLPVAWGHWEGEVAGEGRRERDITGLADARLTLNVNFVGAPALHFPEFRQYRQKTIVGAVAQLTLPTGQYDPTKLINIGANRWSAKGELGVSHAMGRWFLEGAATLWVFGENDDYFGGGRLEQDPLYAFQAHLVYAIRPTFWIGFDIGYADGGTTTVDGETLNTLQRNTRAGVTVQFPVSRQGGIRIAFSNGVRTRIGADFSTLVVGYQYMWGGGL